MQHLEAAPGETNGTYQAEFARNLIDILGHDEALDICARNCWAGVRAAIEQEHRRES